MKTRLSEALQHLCCASRALFHKEADADPLDMIMVSDMLPAQRTAWEERCAFRLRDLGHEIRPEDFDGLALVHDMKVLLDDPSGNEVGKLLAEMLERAA